MRFEIRYLPLAVQDLDQMTEYLLRFYPDTAGKALHEMEQKLAMLSEMPEMCEVYAPRSFYRRMVAGKYLVFYHVNERQHTIDVYRVLRGSWNIEGRLSSDTTFP